MVFKRSRRLTKRQLRAIHAKPRRSPRPHIKPTIDLRNARFGVKIKSRRGSKVTVHGSIGIAGDKEVGARYSLGKKKYVGGSYNELKGAEVEAGKGKKKISYRLNR